jgi:hypothetical protein
LFFFVFDTNKGRPLLQRRKQNNRPARSGRPISLAFLFSSVAVHARTSCPCTPLTGTPVRQNCCDCSGTPSSSTARFCMLSIPVMQAQFLDFSHLFVAGVHQFHHSPFLSVRFHSPNTRAHYAVIFLLHPGTPFLYLLALRTKFDNPLSRISGCEFPTLHSPAISYFPTKASAVMVARFPVAPPHFSVFFFFLETSTSFSLTLHAVTYITSEGC